MSFLEAIFASLIEFLPSWTRGRGGLAVLCIVIGCAGILGGWYFTATRVIVVSVVLLALGGIGLAAALSRS